MTLLYLCPVSLIRRGNGITHKQSDDGMNPVVPCRGEVIKKTEEGSFAMLLTTWNIRQTNDGPTQMIFTADMAWPCGRRAVSSWVWPSLTRQSTGQDGLAGPCASGVTTRALEP